MSSVTTPNRKLEIIFIVILYFSLHSNTTNTCSVTAFSMWTRQCGRCDAECHFYLSLIVLVKWTEIQTLHHIQIDLQINKKIIFHLKNVEIQILKMIRMPLTKFHSNKVLNDFCAINIVCSTHTAHSTHTLYHWLS